MCRENKAMKSSVRSPEEKWRSPLWQDKSMLCSLTADQALDPRKHWKETCHKSFFCSLFCSAHAALLILQFQARVTVTCDRSDHYQLGFWKRIHTERVCSILGGAGISPVATIAHRWPLCLSLSARDALLKPICISALFLFFFCHPTLSKKWCKKFWISLYYTKVTQSTHTHKRCLLLQVHWKYGS